ncbi:hypothetical protein J6590_063507 [Homalodisca vitripennis]|nr:hypothetical protein J6590_063507 [Homalodisca vitripennis]
MIIPGELCQDADSDPWEKGYRLVTMKLRRMGFNKSSTFSSDSSIEVLRPFPNFRHKDAEAEVAESHRRHRGLHSKQYGF